MAAVWATLNAGRVALALRLDPSLNSSRAGRVHPCEDSPLVLRLGTIRGDVKAMITSGLGFPQINLRATLT